MAGSYTLPQTRVFQEFARTPNDVTQNLNPFVIGPNYELIRYRRADERPGCTSGEFTGTDGVKLKWAAGVSGSIVDESWYGVTLEDVYVKLGTLDSYTCPDIAQGAAQATKLEFTLTGDKSLVGDDPDALEFGVPVKAGDYLAYTPEGDTAPKYTKILSVSMGAARAGEVVGDVRNRTTGADANAALVLGVTGYTGEKDATITLHVSKPEGSNNFQVTWLSNVTGVKSTEAKTLTGDVSLGAGLTLSAGTGLAAGDYMATVKINPPYVSDTVTVADFVPSSGAEFTFVRHMDSVDLDSQYLAVYSDTPEGGSEERGVQVAAGAAVDIGAAALFEVFAATAYLNQRNLRTDHVDAVYSVASDADIARELGAYDTDANPLAYALHIMRLNSARSVIKYIGVGSVDAEGFAEALKRASMTSEVYAVCPLTEDHAIIESVVADCKRLSEPEEKSWRISFFSDKAEETVDVTPNVYGVPEKCKVSGTTLTCYGATGDASAVAKFTETVRADDEVTVVNAAAVAKTTKVVRVVSNNTLELADSVTGASSALCRFTVRHRRSRPEYVAAIAAISESYRSRRAYNVFPNTLRASDGNYVSGMYAAAAVCSLACSVQPQQPITNVEIAGFSDLPDVYSKFSRDELNQIAAGGTLILMQDKIGGTVYVRHQISTAYSDGNLNETELSLVKNLDSVSYYFANRFAPYTGRYNVSDDLLVELRGILEDGLAHLETTTEANKLVGPQVIADGTEVRGLYRDPDERDKVYANVGLNLPAPFNNFDLHLQVI